MWFKAESNKQLTLKDLKEVLDKVDKEPKDYSNLPIEFGVISNFDDRCRSIIVDEYSIKLYNY